MIDAYPHKLAMRRLMRDVAMGRHRPWMYDENVSRDPLWREAGAVMLENPRFITPDGMVGAIARMELHWIPPGGPTLTALRNEVLIECNEEDHAAGRPWLSSVVCTFPGPPARSYFRDLERLRGVVLRTREEREDYHVAEYKQAIAFDWDSIDPK